MILESVAHDFRPHPGDSRVVVRIGSRFTTAAHRTGSRVVTSRVVSHGPVLLAASQAVAAGATGGATTRVIRSAAQQVVQRKHLESPWKSEGRVLGASGVARALVMLSGGGGGNATLDQLRQATDKLGACFADERRGVPSQNWIQPMMIGGAILEALLEFLGATEIEAEPDAPVALAPAAG